MGFIFGIIGAMLTLDAAWWIVSSRMAKGTRWRWAVHAFMLAQTVGFMLVITGRMFHSGDGLLPKFVWSSIFLWHFIGLGILLPLGVVALIFWIGRGCVRLAARRQHAETPSDEDANALTRRKFLGVTAALAPPLLNLGLTSIAMAQLNNFRIRRFELPVAELPHELDGLTIAQVSDIHVGRFTSGRVLREMVRQTNELRADLVLLTGDLINDALADLDTGLDLSREVHGKYGTYMIEGNHDLIENGAEFERRARSSGVPFLRDESLLLKINGHPLQLLGLRWDRTPGKYRDAAISASVGRDFKATPGGCVSDPPRASPPRI